MFKLIKSKFFNLFMTLAVIGVTSFVSVVPAFADPTTVDDMWAAVDLSSIQAKVIGLFITIIGIKLVFVAARYISSAVAKARG